MVIANRMSIDFDKKEIYYNQATVPVAKYVRLGRRNILIIPLYPDWGHKYPKLNAYDKMHIRECMKSMLGDGKKRLMFLPNGLVKHYVDTEGNKK